MKYQIADIRGEKEFLLELVANDPIALLNYMKMFSYIAEKSTESDDKHFPFGEPELRRYENGAMAIVYGDSERFKVTCNTNWYDGEMSAEALSLACNMWVCSNLSFNTTGDAQQALANNYHLLYDIAYDHKDACEVAGFLD